MTDDKTPNRRPFGSRKGGEQAPFGSKGAYRRRQQRTPREPALPPDRDFLKRPTPPPPPTPKPEPPTPDPIPDPEPIVEPEPEEDMLYYDGDITDTFDVDLLEEALRADQERLEQEEAIAQVLEAEEADTQYAEEIADYQPRRHYDSEPENQQVALNPLVLFRSAGIMLLGAVVVATMFTWWSPNTFLTDSSIEQLSLALATQSSGVSGPTEAPPASTLIPPTATIAPVPARDARIGIVSGHLGINPSSGLPDPGAVCSDGLTEQEVNYEVAIRVIEGLEEEGFDVDLLEEFDDRLAGYRAQAVVSIHADSCEFYNEFATGYKVASFLESFTAEEDEALVRCLSENYAEVTGLGFHPSITYDMTQYHNFREIAPQTPGAIIELGFLYLDRDFLTSQPEVAAQGIVDGILCYINGEESEEPPAADPFEDAASPTPEADTEETTIDG